MKSMDFSTPWRDLGFILKFAALVLVTGALALTYVGPHEIRLTSKEHSDGMKMTLRNFELFCIVVHAYVLTLVVIGYVLDEIIETVFFLVSAIGTLSFAALALLYFVSCLNATDALMRNDAILGVVCAIICACLGIDAFVVGKQLCTNY